MQSCYASQALQEVRQQNGIVHPVFFEAPCANFISLILIITFLLRPISSEFFVCLFFFYKYVATVVHEGVLSIGHLPNTPHTGSICCHTTGLQSIQKTQMFTFLFIHLHIFFIAFRDYNNNVLIQRCVKNDELMIVEILYLSRPSTWINGCFVAVVNKLLCLF